MNPKPLLPALLAAGIGTISIHAQVTLTFDTDLQGFAAAGDSDAVEWSAENGGSMAITASGGWAGNCASLPMADAGNEDFWAEMQLAETNGGTLSFDVVVRNDDVTIPAGPPNWFQMVVIANSAAGWDQSILGMGIGGGDWPLDPAEQVINVSIQVFSGSETVDDGHFTINSSGNWGNVHIGLNNQGNDGTGTNGVSTDPGSITVYIDNVKIEANKVATPPPTLELKPASAGLHLVSADGGIYTRRMVRTADVANTWIGVATPANPVTYSFTVKESPPQQGYNSFIFFVPSIDGAEIPDYTDPDYQGDHCLRLNFRRDATGEPGASGSVEYKVNSPNSNGPAGNEFWVNDSEGPSTGLGGTLAYVSSADIVGTWSLTFTSDTDFTVTAPDGTASSGAMLPATAALFDTDLHVYFGNVPGSEANQGLVTTYSNITISGIDFSVDENFTEFIDEDGFLMPDSFLQVAPQGRSGVVVATDETRFWLQWTLPAPDFALEQSLDLDDATPWEPMLMDNAFNVQGGFVLLLLDSLELLDPEMKTGYFRLAKPDPNP